MYIHIYVYTYIYIYTKHKMVPFLGPLGAWRCPSTSPVYMYLNVYLDRYIDIDI